jgi:hypothetical protein
MMPPRYMWLSFMWAIGYAALMVAVIAAMFRARDWTVKQLSTQESNADWQQWREDVRKQPARLGAVQRRVPKSEEPPALVLLRDYFAVSLVGAVLFSSALYWTMAWFVSGILDRPKRP